VLGFVWAVFWMWLYREPENYPLAGGVHPQGGSEIDANPSPGNKAGSTNLVDVPRSADPITAKGCVFMDTPGYDPVSATGKVAGGANLVCFTTGRGSVFGCNPAPSVKITTNPGMYRWLEEDMDVNCGMILDGEEGVDQTGRRISC